MYASVMGEPDADAPVATTLEKAVTRPTSVANASETLKKREPNICDLFLPGT
jgi:hypothetical protein